MLAVLLLEPFFLFFKLNLAYFDFWRNTDSKWAAVTAGGGGALGATCLSPVPASRHLEHSPKSLQNTGEDHQAGGRGGGRPLLLCVGQAQLWRIFLLLWDFHFSIYQQVPNRKRRKQNDHCEWRSPWRRTWTEILGHALPHEHWPWQKTVKWLRMYIRV